MDRAEQIRKLKQEAANKRPTYGIKKISDKRAKKLEEDKEMQKRDMEFYKSLWLIRPHTCENCGCGLGKEFKLWFAHHLLPKHTYQQFRHDPRNIVLLCLEDHSKCETNYDTIPKIKARVEQAERELLGNT